MRAHDDAVEVLAHELAPALAVDLVAQLREVLQAEAMLTTAIDLQLGDPFLDHDVAAPGQVGLDDAHEVTELLLVEERRPAGHPADLEILHAGHQPQVRPWFCSSRYFESGPKYSTIALASISRLPVSTSSASGQGLLAPSSSMAFSLAPAALLS